MTEQNDPRLLTPEEIVDVEIRKMLLPRITDFIQRERVVGRINQLFKAQLARKVCPDCLGQKGFYDREDGERYKVMDCPTCQGTGYKGRPNREKIFSMEALLAAAEEGRRDERERIRKMVMGKLRYSGRPNPYNDALQEIEQELKLTKS